MTRFIPFLVAVCAVACSGPPGDHVFDETPPPNDSSNPWNPVADGLAVHCGTLDCHGSSARNFRIYGLYGQRLDHQVTGTGATNDDEYAASYESLVMLQPEVLNQLVLDHAAEPERWIVITKGRGTEHHKGGSRMTAGDAMDTCLLSWIAGTEVPAACTQASEVLPPQGF